MRVASEMETFRPSPTAVCRYHKGTALAQLPDPLPIMIDFDHPIKNMRYETHRLCLCTVAQRRKPLHVTRPWIANMTATWQRGRLQSRTFTLTWEVDRRVANESGLVHRPQRTPSAHPNLFSWVTLSQEDPTGERMAIELDRCNEPGIPSAYLLGCYRLKGLCHHLWSNSEFWSSIAAQAEVKKTPSVPQT